MVNKDTLAKYIPDPKMVTTLPVSEVAMQLLKVVQAQLQSGSVHPAAVFGRDALFDGGPFGVPCYPRNGSPGLEDAVAEAFNWLAISGLIMPAAPPNAAFYRLTRLGRLALSSDAAFRDFAKASMFPKALLHASIADEVWAQIAQGAFDVAVFIAFRAVEVAVREASGFPESDHGVPMIRRAFHKDNGPLTRQDDPEAEKEALSALFAGALGSYKNPHSHRSVGLTDATEAQEMLVLASHLLRIVESRTCG